MELNNYLSFFPRSRASNNMSPEELNEILLHAVPNGWAEQAYLKGWEFLGDSYKETFQMFKLMEIVDQVY